jgi:hypothetical protein
VVLHYVPDRPHLFIEAAPTFHSKALAKGNLNPFDVVAIPDRLEKGIGEAEVKQILNRFLAEVMVDPEDRRLGEELEKRSIELLRRDEITAKRFFNDQPGVLCASGFGQPPCNDLKLARRDG